jgi:hypothetical protein
LNTSHIFDPCPYSGIFPRRDATTALALARDRDYTEIVAVIKEEEQAWLLKTGASVRKHDLRGLSPLDRAALAADPGDDRAQRFPRIARLLLDGGAEVTIHAAVALTDSARIRELVGRDPDLLRREIHSSRGGAVSLAVKHGHLETVRLLLDLGADVDERIMLHELEEPALSWGAPLWYAALAGRRDVAELLLDRGADPNANVYASGWPLRNACQRNDEALKRLLVDRGAKPALYGCRGRQRRGGQADVKGGCERGPGKGVDLVCCS